MTQLQFLHELLTHFKKRELPFNVEDVTELDTNGMITLRNDEHPYIIRIEKLPIPADYDDVNNKEFFWKDQSGRGFTNTFNATELFEAFRKEVDDEEDFKTWIEFCNEGDEYDSGTPNEIKRIK